MKKHFAKTIAILSLFVALSVGAVNVSTGGGCSTCKPTAQYAVSASAQNATQPPAQGGGGCVTCKPLTQYAMSASAQAPALDSTQPEDSFSFAFFLARLAMSFLYLP